MKAILFAVLLAGFAVGADAQDPTGSWIWTSTDLGGGVVETPASVGYTVRLHLHEDYRAIKLVDDAPVEHSTWEVAYVWVGPTHVAIYATGLGGGMDMVFMPAEYLYLQSYPEQEFRLETYAFVSAIPVGEASFGSVKALYR